MTFTRQDAATFLVGLLAAVGVQLGSVLVQLDTQPVEDWSQWLVTVGTGLLAATGRYLITEFAQRQVN